MEEFIHILHSSGRSGLKRLGSGHCGAALTAPSPVGPPLLFLTPDVGRCLSTLVISCFVFARRSRCVEHAEVVVLARYVGAHLQALPTGRTGGEGSAPAKPSLHHLVPGNHQNSFDLEFWQHDEQTAHMSLRCLDKGNAAPALVECG